MRKDGEATKARIMDTAKALILSKGYSGTTVDDVIRNAEVTKGAFFHHFKSKEDLAREIVERYAEEDRQQLDRMVQTVETLSGDPAQQLILLVGLYIDLLESGDPMPDGCLYASYCYESGIMEPGTMKPVVEMILYWRQVLAKKIRKAIRAHKPRVPVDPEVLADQALVVFEGAYVLSKTTKDTRILVQQLGQFRSYLALLFQREKDLSMAAR